MVWGDAKPDNILVREDGNLVLVDFAGGATDGWVDWKVMDTLEGDLQASPRIEEFILSKSERK
jgi:serine/threonine protein kinase